MAFYSLTLLVGQYGIAQNEIKAIAQNENQSRTNWI